MKNRKLKIIYNYILIVFLIISSTVLFNYSKNEKIEKEITKISKINGLKTLDQEGDNYRLVTSADNVQVPVPKGYVASQVEGENYVSPEYSHTSINHKVSSTPTELTWSSPVGEEYPWTQDENGIWISGNQGIQSSESTLESEEFDYVKGSTVTINYTYSTDGSFKLVIMNLTNNTEIEVVNSNGNYSSSFDYTTSNKTYKMNNWATGRYKIRAILKTSFSHTSGLDLGYIKPSTYFKVDENGTQTIVEDIKTKIHDGGFVIYQLKDEEIEIDPNGTNVVINDTNKGEAQSERNQYVWVPVPNVEDIVRTKSENNGIMQFGQGYYFTNTSILKSGNIGEPRILITDRTKYYLQKYLNASRRENYFNDMQENFAGVVKSINKYKGFYIGRYETGDDYSHYQKRCYIIPRIVRYNNKLGNVSWYDSYKELERLAGKTEKYVETGMTYDSLWDYALKWVNNTGTRSYEDISSDSGIWGNYYNINAENLKYKESADEDEKTNVFRSVKPTGGITEIIYMGEIFRDSPTSSNNIFDIAGNVSEMTKSLGTITSSRRQRGGKMTTSTDSIYQPARNAENTESYYSGDDSMRCSWNAYYKINLSIC